MTKHRDGYGTPITVGTTVKMHHTADSGYGATGVVQALLYTVNHGDPAARVLWDDNTQDVYRTTRLRAIWTPAR